MGHNQHDLEANFILPLFEDTTLLSQAYNQSDKELQEMLDMVAPSNSMEVTNKPEKPWFNKYMRDQWKVVRNRGKPGSAVGLNINGRHIRLKETSITDCGFITKNNY